VWCVAGGISSLSSFGDGLTNCISIARDQTPQVSRVVCVGVLIHCLSFVARRPVRIRAAQIGHRSSHRLQYFINQ